MGWGLLWIQKFSMTKVPAKIIFIELRLEGVTALPCVHTCGSVMEGGKIRNVPWETGKIREILHI